jgi:hypothetical protein
VILPKRRFSGIIFYLLFAPSVMIFSNVDSREGRFSGIDEDNYKFAISGQFSDYCIANLHKNSVDVRMCAPKPVLEFEKEP